MYTQIGVEHEPKKHTHADAQFITDLKKFMTVHKEGLTIGGVTSLSQTNITGHLHHKNGSVVICSNGRTAKGGEIFIVGNNKLKDDSVKQVYSYFYGPMHSSKSARPGNAPTAVVYKVLIK